MDRATGALDTLEPALEQHGHGQRTASVLTSGSEHGPNNAQTKAGVLGWAEDADGVRHILQLRSRCEPDDRDVPGDASSLLLTAPHDDQIPRFTHSGPQNRGLDSQRPEGVDPQTTTRLFAPTRPVHIS